LFLFFCCEIIGIDNNLLINFRIRRQILNEVEQPTAAVAPLKLSTSKHLSTSSQSVLAPKSKQKKGLLAKIRGAIAVEGEMEQMPSTPRFVTSISLSRFSIWCYSFIICSQMQLTTTRRTQLKREAEYKAMWVYNLKSFFCTSEFINKCAYFQGSLSERRRNFKNSGIR
jgi:hypothetical protein